MEHVAFFLQLAFVRPSLLVKSCLDKQEGWTLYFSTLKRFDHT